VVFCSAEEFKEGYGVDVGVRCWRTVVVAIVKDSVRMEVRFTVADMVSLIPIGAFGLVQILSSSIWRFVLAVGCKMPNLMSVFRDLLFGYRISVDEL
jgi:hypothetical protein